MTSDTLRETRATVPALGWIITKHGMIIKPPGTSPFSQLTLNNGTVWELREEKLDIGFDISWRSLSIPVGQRVAIYSKRSKLYYAGTHLCKSDCFIRHIHSAVQESTKDIPAQSRLCGHDGCIKLGAGLLPIIESDMNIRIDETLIAILCNNVSCDEYSKISYYNTTAVISTTDKYTWLYLVHYEDALLSVSTNQIVSIGNSWPIDFIVGDDLKRPRLLLKSEHEDFSNRCTITLFTQFSMNRLERFRLLLSRWRECPVSAVIYISNALDLILVNYYSDFLLSLKSRVTLQIIYNPVSLYPINSLRNLALKSVRTDFVIYVETDFLPSLDIDTWLEKNAVPKIIQARSPLAIVVPILALREQYAGPIPESMEQIRSLSTEHVYLTDKVGHGPSGWNIFKQDAVLDNPFYEVCFESGWEPYYLLERKLPLPKINSKYLNQYLLWENLRQDSPFQRQWMFLSPDISDKRVDMSLEYDSRFCNQGGDKQSHSILLNALGFQFKVARDHFFVHLDHEKGLEGWPGGLKADFLMNHTIKYFQDFLPEVESAFGSDFRWPRGCSQPLSKTIID